MFLRGRNGEWGRGGEVLRFRLMGTGLRGRDRGAGSLDRALARRASRWAISAVRASGEGDGEMEGDGIVGRGSVCCIAAGGGRGFDFEFKGDVFRYLGRWMDGVCFWWIMERIVEQ